MIRKTSFFIFVLGLLFLAGCATPKHQLPDIQDNRVYAAAAEIAASAEPTPREVSDHEAVARISELYNQLKPAALEVCRYVGEHH